MMASFVQVKDTSISADYWINSAEVTLLVDGKFMSTFVRVPEPVRQIEAHKYSPPGSSSESWSEQKAMA
jgi:hypothetical protein